MKATSGGRASYIAECETCGWMCHEKNAMAVGSRHAETKAHTVYVLVERGFYFDGSKRIPTEAR